MVNNELERMCKELIMTEFKALHRYFPEGTKENPEESRSVQKVSGLKYDTYSELYK
jgi:hypothetical protein